MTQGPCRTLLADLTGKDHRRNRVVNAYFSLFMAIDNVLGFVTGSYGSYGGWYMLLPFTVTPACSAKCANLKSAFFIDVACIAITMYASVSAWQEFLLSSRKRSATIVKRSDWLSVPQEAFLWELFGTFRYLPRLAWIVLLITALTWIGWFRFLFFDTDWMGWELYGGKPNDGKNYNEGVRTGALGLMLNSVLLGVASISMEKICRKLRAGFVWGISNILMSLCFIAMMVVAFALSRIDSFGHGSLSNGAVIAALVVFTVLSIPLAVVVSLGSGPWDQLLGGGNSPPLAVAALVAFASGLVAILSLPGSRTDRNRTAVIHA